MPTTERDLRALAYLAQRLRTETHGAGKWDDAGLWPVLKRLEGQNLALTVERVTRHAQDATARTPAAIERPFVPDAPKSEPWRPAKRDESCNLHPGEWADNCRICRAPRAHDEDPSDRPKRRQERAGNVTARVDELRRLKAGGDA